MGSEMCIRDRDNTLMSFELATGSKLHRNANSRKCNCLTLGRWSRWSQADSPLDYMSVVSEINFLGITLTRSSGKTRAANGQELVLAPIVRTPRAFRSWSGRAGICLTSISWSEKSVTRCSNPFPLKNLDLSLAALQPITRRKSNTKNE